MSREESAPPKDARVIANVSIAIGCFVLLAFIVFVYPWWVFIGAPLFFTHVIGVLLAVVAIRRAPGRASVALGVNALIWLVGTVYFLRYR